MFYFVMLRALRLLTGFTAFFLVRQIAAQAPQAPQALRAPETAVAPAALLREFGTSPLASDITFPVAKDVQYRLAWAVRIAPDSAGRVLPDLKKPANFLYLAGIHGIPTANIRLAVVISGPATAAVMKNEAYKAANGVDNASAAILEALNAAGVEIVVCGEALIAKRISRGDVLPFVKVAPTAAMALATLGAQGYTIMP